MTDSASWPELPLAAWQDTLQTLHMWTQIAGKVRMALTPPVNHWWHTTLYVNERGLTTSPVPHVGGVFEIQFDFLDHQLKIRSSDGAHKSLPLEPQAVASFYDRLMRTLSSMGVAVTINTKPQEVADPIPFDQDYRHASYDPEYAQRFWRILLSTGRVLQEFRGRFLGKCSPVQFFWGSFDLACTRFSGRPAPPRKGVISSEAYSHEVISAGFWPGGSGIDGPAFYSYTSPQPPGLPEEPVRPAAASWSTQLSEFILMYDDVRRTSSPGDALMEFLDSTYVAGAKRANWDRRALERGGTAVHTA
jgi:hypothetical protein